MLKVGDEIIVTKVSKDDTRYGVRADMLGTVTDVLLNGYVVALYNGREALYNGREALLCGDQVRRF